MNHQSSYERTWTRQTSDQRREKWLQRHGRLEVLSVKRETEETASSTRARKHLLDTGESQYLISITSTLSGAVLWRTVLHVGLWAFWG